MAIQTVPAARADALAVAGHPVPAGPALFGTGPAQPVHLADLSDLDTADLAERPAVSSPAVDPGSIPAAGRAERSRRRRLGRRIASWGAGPDGAHLAWRATPLRVYRLTDGTDGAARPAGPVSGAATRPAAVAPVQRRVDADLEVAIEFATDFSVDLLHAPARLAAPAARVTAPVRCLLAGIRGMARAAAGWGSGTSGAHLSWGRPAAPRVYRLSLPPLLAPAPVTARPAPPALRHRAPDDDAPVPLRELPSTPTTAPPSGGRSWQRAHRPGVLRLASCSPRARNLPAPSGWSPRRTGSPAPRAWRPSRPVATRSMPRSLRVSHCRWSNRTSTAPGARSPSSSPGARGQPPVRGSPSSSPDRA
jgi:hypothetical protein